LSAGAHAPWINLHARDFGRLGVVMGFGFWIGFSATVVIISSAIGRTLSERRTAR
jgi:uncharacterized BrkB/YihY/UPF0761 family membrane protein